MDTNFRASMGPRSFERGNVNSPGGLSLAGDASMGPRSFERGNSWLLFVSPSKHQASMGPRSFERGNITRANHPKRADHRFNGAALIRARKYRVHKPLVLSRQNGRFRA